MSAAAASRRALRRVARGKTISITEAGALMALRGPALDELLALAGSLRDLGHGNTVTYSRKVFIPLTMLCRDRCHYCTFAKPPARVQAPYLTPEQAVAIAQRGREAGCKEALFTLGDKPEDRYLAARRWLDARGHRSTLDYMRAVAIRVIEETGLLPHLNPGVMNWQEMARLKHVSASMGLMLEQATDRLTLRGMPHYRSPDKLPGVRLRAIEDAGRLSIPFTSGILVGIGETHEERAASLFALREVHRRSHHLQEVIVQPFRAKPRTAMRRHPEPDLDELLATAAVARVLLGPRMNLQAPPNLADADYPGLLDAGINDWGGISPVTPDHVNPEAPWPPLEELQRRTRERGFALRERLCVYPEYARRPNPFIAGKMQRPVAALLGEDGLARAGRRPEPVAWQDPEVAYRARPPALDAAPAGAAALRRDADVVYGSFDVLDVPGTRAWARRPRDGTKLDADVARALAKAEERRPMTDAEALALFQADGPALDALCRIADDLRRDAVGDDVTYVINRNINFTNVCYTGCRFCAFAQREVDPESYTLTLDQVGQRALEASAYGATEVCIQGGLHPSLAGDFYFQLLDAVKARAPALHIHAFSPMEVFNGAARLGISYREFLEECRHRGLGTIPGTAAEILDDEVRSVLTKGKLPADTWEEIVRTAHVLGIRSSSTIMYGHVDAPPHWVAHLRRLARIQAETGGFTEFVPLSFVHHNAPIYLAGKARPGASFEEQRRMHAVARVMLDGLIPNVQVSWVKIGVHASQLILQGGANDFGGTLMEETISRMAGSEWGVRMEPSEIEEAIRAIGRIPAQRTTTYGRVAPRGIPGSQPLPDHVVRR